MIPVENNLPVIDYKYSITVLPEIKFNSEKEGNDILSSFTKYITSAIINKVHIDIFKYRGVFNLYMYDEYEYYSMELKHGEYITFKDLCKIFNINEKTVLDVILNDINKKYNTDSIDNEISLYDNLVLILNTSRDIGVPTDADVNNLQINLKRGLTWNF